MFANVAVNRKLQRTQDHHVASEQQYMHNVMAVRALTKRGRKLDLIEAGLRIAQMVEWLDAKAQHGISGESERAGAQAEAWRTQLNEIVERIGGRAG
jgi:hypothetical protein